MGFGVLVHKEMGGDSSLTPVQADFLDNLEISLPAPAI
jgi:hypothetical protein